MKKKDEVKECNQNDRPLVSGPLRGSGLCALSPSPCATMQGFAGDVLSATPQLNCENGHAAGRLFPCSTTPSATTDCRGARQYKRPQTDVINDTQWNGMPISLQTHTWLVSWGQFALCEIHKSWLFLKVAVLPCNTNVIGICWHWIENCLNKNKY